ncbi:HAD-IB family hydrolase [Streptomyces tubercidicus]|uniref:HAD family hydrolase n=1 Tax=Streptomyces tubercidicus TaxID=47759 RepID=UPI002E0ECE12|nr:HAD-IB family hydrolase [Streptomyces tubercidicus]WSX21491.1 HAD-IB family hydrolase [Streptomyces tubercidicus]
MRALDTADAGRTVDVAFFDVDETLLTFKSMFRFLDHHFSARGLPPEHYRRAAAELRRRAAEGVPRSETNQDYYQHYAGRSVEEVMEHGRQWFAAELARGTALHEPAVEALYRHHRYGALTVLVSGSFPPCLEPVRQLLGADMVLCSEPEITAGRYTGRLETPMIGEQKGRAAAELLARHGVPPSRAAAYGDHSSDLSLLRAVGHPVAVGDDAALGTYVRQVGGSLLPGVPG